jgi:hypothetical protein
MRFMLDSNIYDEIIATPGMTELLNELHQSGQIEIIKTHIQEDELEKIPDSDKRSRIMKVPGTKVRTEGAIWNVSRWGQGTWGSGSGDIKIEDIRKGIAKHSEDALIATTAAVKADILVTNEKRLSKRIAASGSRIKVWNYADFQKYINTIKKIELL